MKFILGKKVNMTQVFDKNGNVRPATIVGDVAPLVVTQIKSKATDGYDAVQVGFGTRKIKNINKAQQGHSKDLGNFSTFKEFPGVAGKTFTVGEKIDVSSFKEGDIVEISAISKGYGNAGMPAMSAATMAVKAPALGTIIPSYPIIVKFVSLQETVNPPALNYIKVLPNDTLSSNLSMYATSSMPYFDDICKNRSVTIGPDGIPRQTDTNKNIFITSIL